MATQIQLLVEGIEQMNANLIKMNENMGKTIENTKKLGEETEDTKKKNQSLLRSFSELSDPGTWYGRAWVAVRRISSRVAPEFWAIQNATVGAMDTVKTYYKFIERKGDKDNERVKKSLSLRIREAAANKERVDALRDELKINNFQMRNNKMLVTLYEKQKTARDKLEEGSDEYKLMDTRMEQTAARIRATESGATARGRFEQGRKNIRNFQEKIAKKIKPKEIQETLRAVFTMAKAFMKIFLKLVLFVTAFYLFATQVDLVGFFKSIVAGIIKIVDMIRFIIPYFADAFGQFFSGFFGIVEGLRMLLSGEDGAFATLITGILDFVIGGIYALLLLGISVIGGPIAVIGAFVIGFFSEWLKDAKDSATATASRIAEGLIILATIAGAIIFIASGSFLYAAGVAIAGAVLAALNRAISGNFANGGITSRGMQVVGERGPELVSLPAGSRVFSNRESRAMAGNTTINVTVQGRVGASDAELQEIAQKIGRMVNMEVNRTTASRTRGA